MKLVCARQVVAVLVAGLAAGYFSAPARAVETDIRRDATVAAIEQVSPCVVNIATATVVERGGDPMLELMRRYFGWRVPTERREEPYFIGSGVIVDEEGYILTNFHVLEHASRVQVKLSDGRVFDADPIVYTPLKDVALLKIRAQAGERFTAIKLAKDDDLLLGETVLALGNPYGLGGSVTRGILSAKNRRPASGNEKLGFQDWLQTDADINPGNSGGPLVNLRGELIGINVAEYREDMGMGVGFAIPVKQISATLAEFFTPEVHNALWFGARVNGGTGSLLVTAVQRGSPADEAGLRVGDRIVQVNGRAPRELMDFNRLLTNQISMAEKKFTAALEVEQNSERRKVTTRLVPFDELIRQRLGLLLTPIVPPDTENFGVNPGEGLLIKGVEKKSPADQAGLQPGMLITVIDDRKIVDLISFTDVLSAKKTGDRVALSVVLRRVQDNLPQFRLATANLTVR